MSIRLSACALPRCRLLRYVPLATQPLRYRSSWAQMGKLQERLRLVLAEGNVNLIQDAWIKSKYMTWEGRSRIVEDFRAQLLSQGVPRKKIETIAQILVKDDAEVAHYIPAGLLASLLRYTIEERFYDWSVSILKHLSNDFHLNHENIVKNYRLAPVYLEYLTARSDTAGMEKIIKATSHLGGGAIYKAHLSAYMKLGQWTAARQTLDDTRKAVGWTAAFYAELVVNALRLQHEIRSGNDSEDLRNQYGSNLATIEDTLGGFFGVPHLPWKLQDAEVTDKEYIEMLSTFTDAVLRSRSTLNTEATLPNIGLLSAPAFRTILRAVMETKGSPAALALVKRCCYAYDPAETTEFRLREEADEDLDESLLPSSANTWSVADRTQTTLAAPPGVTHVPLGSGLIPDPRSRLIYCDLRDFRMLYRGALREMRWDSKFEAEDSDRPKFDHKSHPALLLDWFQIRSQSSNFKRPTPTPPISEVCDTLEWLENNVAHRRSRVEGKEHKLSHSGQTWSLVESNQLWRSQYLENRGKRERQLLSGPLPPDTVKKIVEERLRFVTVDDYLDNILDASNIGNPKHHQTTVPEEAGSYIQSRDPTASQEESARSREPNVAYVGGTSRSIAVKPMELEAVAENAHELAGEVLVRAVKEATSFTPMEESLVKPPAGSTGKSHVQRMTRSDLDGSSGKGSRSKAGPVEQSAKPSVARMTLADLDASSGKGQRRSGKPNAPRSSASMSGGLARVISARSQPQDGNTESARPSDDRVPRAGDKRSQKAASNESALAPDPRTVMIPKETNINYFPSENRSRPAAPVR